MLAIPGAVLITGANGGIGSAIVHELISQGCFVVSTDIGSCCLPESVLSSSFFLGYISCDLSLFCGDKKIQQHFLDRVSLALGEKKLYGLVNNAAIQINLPILDLSYDHWLTSFRVNVMAPAILINLFHQLLQGAFGVVVNIGSIHSQLTKSGFAAYSTSKSAMAGLTRAASIELGKSIRVTGIEPAAISTPMLEAGFQATPEKRTHLENCHPTGTIGSPADVANAVLFLLDSRNSFLNGCVLPLGGGIHSRLHDPA